MFWAVGRAVADGVDGGETSFLEGGRCEVNKAMESHRGHQVDEQAVNVSGARSLEGDHLPCNLVQ